MAVSLEHLYAPYHRSMATYRLNAAEQREVNRLIGEAAARCADALRQFNKEYYDLARHFPDNPALAYEAQRQWLNRLVQITHPI